MEISVLGSVAYDNIFLVDQIPALGERVYGNRLGKFIGGMAANQAIEAARYVDNINILGCVGSDTEGLQIINSFKKKGLNTQYLQEDADYATGQTYMYLLNDDYYSIVTPGANLHVLPDEVEKSIMKMDSGFVLASLEINLEAVISALSVSKKIGIESVLIPSPVENCKQEIIDLSDSIILNTREFDTIFGLKINNLDDAENQLAKLKGKKKRILVTIGKFGAALLQNNQIYLSDAMRVNSIDSVGAGDALAGAFIGCLVKGISSAKALSIGCIAGALVTSKAGPQSSEHTFSDVQKAYKQYYELKGVNK